ncbi:hypothetical protein BT96DRAFT_362623 [Gymnopus androsaceus JB14]|uniref:Uncharacterized protein n=1 Tax=Gymnopus androsaceus JB14 TaxID=1447944 RepID=A0A6A4GXA7_9AGAR|nr:hypothetical protein BT96DRAFT_362623 [Gymnopus androsaceus JB14]
MAIYTPSVSSSGSYTAGADSTSTNHTCLADYCSSDSRLAIPTPPTPVWAYSTPPAPAQALVQVHDVYASPLVPAVAYTPTYTPIMIPAVTSPVASVTQCQCSMSAGRSCCCRRSRHRSRCHRRHRDRENDSPAALPVNPVVLPRIAQAPTPQPSPPLVPPQPTRILLEPPSAPINRPFRADFGTGYPGSD